MEITSILVVFLGFVIATVLVRDLDPVERRYGMLAFGAHLVLSLAHWELIQLYGGGDAELYRDVGVQLGKLLDYDPARFGPELLKLALHQADVVLPVDVPGAGANTGTMCALGGFLTYVLGPSLLPLCLLATVGTWVGQLCLYRVARQELAGNDRRAAALGFLFVPSVIFWGAGFQKEAVVLTFFGPLALSTYNVLRHRRLLYVAGMLLGGLGVGLLKSYTLLAYVAAVGAFFYADRVWRGAKSITIRPAYVLLALALAFGGLVVMGKVMPEYEATRVVDTLAKQQQAWTGREGVGSNTTVLGGDGARSVPQQIALMPLALVNALLRPSVFDIRNGPTFIAAVENTLIVLGLFSILRPANRAVSLGSLARTPILVFAAVFVLIFGVGIGLGAMNLGSLSRYRAPLMPFYVTIVLVLRSRLQATRAEIAPRRRPSAPARRRQPVLTALGPRAPG